MYIKQTLMRVLQGCLLNTGFTVTLTNSVTTFVSKVLECSSCSFVNLENT